MIKSTIQLLDEVVTLILKKTANEDYSKFEFYLVISLNITRHELISFSKISDLTAEALSQLFAFRAHELYYRTHSDIYSRCLDLFHELSKYNDKLNDHSLKGLIGVKDKEWANFFNQSLKKIIEQTKPNN